MTTIPMEKTALSARPKGDWLLYALVIAASFCLPLALRAGGWVPRAEHLPMAALLGCLLGLLLARSPWTDATAWLYGTILGAAYAMQFVGRLIPPGGVIRNDLARVWRWVSLYVFEGYKDPNLPLSYGATHFYWQTRGLIDRVYDWVTTVQRGGASTDPAPLMLVVWLAVWLLSWNLAFQLARHRRTLRALVPLGVALLAAVGYTGLGLAPARIFLALALIIFVWGNTGRMQWLWQQTGVRMAEGLRRHVFLTGLPLAAIILLLALLVPQATTPGTAQFFWDRLGGRIKSFYEQLDRAFAGRNPLNQRETLIITREVPGSTGIDREGLAEHDIRGGAPTSDVVVALVTTSDMDPQTGPQGSVHYWRQKTYDRYTGHGWSSRPTEIAAFAAEQPWKEPAYPGAMLGQTIALQLPMALALGVNEPIFVAGDYRVQTRGDGDLAAFQTDALTYTVSSLVPIATPDQLRTAEGPYLDWVRERFLPLPVVPSRVLQKAQEVVEAAGATTRYDKAVAIESYLRGFVYDLEVEPPKDGVDVVDYYLFTTQRGYCDYSATAMVVMLRSLGIAARYASGYGQGTYDPTLNAWVVRGKNAHAWAEVYFPGYGWIEFEPTASQSPLVRGVGPAVGQPTATPTPTAEPTTQAVGAAPTPAPETSQGIGLKGNWFLRLAAGAGSLLLLGGALWFIGRGAFSVPHEPRQIIWHIYGQLQRRARRRGIRPREGHTPREFLHDVVAGVEQRSGGKVSVARDIHLIGQLYERARYSAETLTHADSARVRAAWERLRKRV